MCLWGGGLWCYGEGACDVIVRIVRGLCAMGGLWCYGCGAMGGGRVVVLHMYMYGEGLVPASYCTW